jgi:hypothetical protein
MSQPTIRNGSKGAAVRLCQERLNAKGFHVAVDGDFGPGTETAVEQFQASLNLTADGIVGPMTWAHLMSGAPVPTPKDVIAEQRAALLALIPADCHADARAVLEAAIAKLGCKEIPNGSNGGPELAEVVEGPGGDGKVPSAYYLHWGVTDKNVLRSMPPWCAIYVCYAMRVGLKKNSWTDIPLGNWFGAAQQIEDWGKKHKTWTSPLPATVAPGSLFTISRAASGSDAGGRSVGAGHVGFIICDHGDGTVTTVEGNVGNAVGSHKRKKASLRGVVTWW